MSQIYQCDRCGRTFKRINYGSHKYWLQKGKRPDFTIREYDKGMVDLCDNCIRSFNDWFHHPEIEAKMEEIKAGQLVIKGSDDGLYDFTKTTNENNCQKI